MNAQTPLNLEIQSAEDAALAASIPGRVRSLVRSKGLRTAASMLGTSIAALYPFMDGRPVRQVRFLSSALEYIERGHDPREIDTSDMPRLILETCRALGVNATRLACIIGCTQPTLSYWINTPGTRGRTILAATLAMAVIRHEGLE